MTPHPWTHINPIGPLLRPDQAAHYLGMSRRSYDRMSAAGIVPRPQPLGINGHAKFVPKRFLDAMIEAHFAQEGDQ